MDSRQDYLGKETSILIFSLLGSVEMLITLLFLLSTENRHRGEFLFNLLERGFVELTILLLLSVVLLGITIALIRDRSRYSSVLIQFTINNRKFLSVLVCAGLVAGWAAVTIPPDYFGRFAGYYQWLRPFIAVVGLLALQALVLYLTATTRINRLKDAFSLFKSRIFLIVFLSALLVFLLAYVTSFGLISDTPLWNVPGIPVSGTQMFYIVFIVTGIFLFFCRFPKLTTVLKRKEIQIGILVIVFLTTLLVWGTTPLPGDSLSVAPSLANPEPYPRRDARIHDLGALSILYGEGINFRGYTDKPLYMVLLAIFHLIAGYDYGLLVWVQIAFLSLIPVLVYLLGKHFHSPLFGLLMAAMVIVQHRNAIVLARMISSVNVKVLATETLVFMGIVLLTLVLFKWDNQKDKETLLLAGGVVGALSLVRLNPLLFYPFIGLIIVLYYRKRRKLIIPRLLIFSAGFLIIFSPWVISGVNPSGTPFLIQKLQDVLQNRIAPVIHVPIHEEKQIIYQTKDDNYFVLYDVNERFSTRFPTNTTAGPRKILGMRQNLVTGDESENGNFLNYLKITGSHFIHNYIASVMALPDTLSRSGIKVLAQRDYWADSQIWNGRLSSGLLRFIVINLILVSIGTAFSWKKHRWRGLIPLVIFLVYDLAISISLTSGGRYIVPIIWILFFYYGMAFVFIVDFLIKVFGSNHGNDCFVQDQPDVRNQNKSGLAVIFSGLVIIALLVPVANMLLPRFIHENPAEKAERLFAASAVKSPQAFRFISGTILYPIYYPGSGEVELDLYNANQVKTVFIPLFGKNGAVTVMSTKIRPGDPGLLIFNEGDQLIKVFIFRENQLLEYWSSP